jgi:hypothetical protein
MRVAALLWVIAGSSRKAYQAGKLIPIALKIWQGYADGYSLFRAGSQEGAAQ